VVVGFKKGVPERNEKQKEGAKKMGFNLSVFENP